MTSRVSSHAIVGACSLMLGAATGWMGLARAAWLSGSVVGTPFWVIALVAGCVLILAGSLILLTAFRVPPPPAATVPAHIAFQSRMKLPQGGGLPTPPTPARPRVTTPSSAHAAPTPAPFAREAERVASSMARAGPNATPNASANSREETLSDLDGQIRELTRRINKAGVMLATGQLSQQGYLTYVEDLKRQRAQIEAQRVTTELQT